MAKEMQEGKLNPNEGKLKALQAAMAKIEKDFGKGSIMKLGDEHVENIKLSLQAVSLSTMHWA